MELYLDTASVREIREANSTGLLSGVTTNPTLIMKEGRNYNAALKEIATIVNGPVSAETVSPDAKGMVREGLAFSKLHSNIIVKVPLTVEGLKACRELTKKGIRVNATLCFSANQAMLAAKSSAWCVSPFVGRIDDQGGDGMELIEEIVTVFRNYGFRTKILVASIRSPLHVRAAALIGADIATMPYKVFFQLYRHSLTDAGIKRFLEDWSKVPKR